MLQKSELSPEQGRRERKKPVGGKRVRELSESHLNCKICR